jgi:acyl-CoA reductase-like NAD-dependent aldehyde dehydrogenase
MNLDGDYTLTIDGKSVAGAATFDVLNPANETVIGQAPDCSRAQLDEAVAAARRAFPKWTATPIEERRAKLLALSAKIAENGDSLARLLTREQGKPFPDAQGDVLGGAMWLQGAASLNLPVVVNEDTAERRSETRRVPIGVVGAIAPWNFPIILACSSSARPCCPATPWCSSRRRSRP